ncbi:type II toxin-antitoxin system VapC family toxin [Blastococcus goldschmidtiae]|uniref:Ribonuclease VapC n=1 Tax=Blastococcus goldschmidtiae TaxID=3075546 RepID=A0ABU2K9I7_9ACTN|nr:PIN domain-containing protein [Blastococcus sp. DSM 46792]MDT0276854.1 PIN domain-containing protein [Blastococcus sp. DSM 46792]
MILVDTNVLVAAARTADTNHVAAARLLETLDEPLLVPPTVLAEVCYLLNEWSGPGAEVRFLRDLRSGGLQLAELTTADVARMADLVERYADLRLGGTDASLVAIAERLRIDRIATFDRRHFTVVRPAHVASFTLLPEVRTS